VVIVAYRMSETIALTSWRIAENVGAAAPVAVTEPVPT
jgi:hypothetical protein